MTSNVMAEPLRDDDPSDERKMAAYRFASVDDVPERAFFAKEYIALYKKHVNELIRRMEHLVEEAENFETESEADMEWNGKQLAGLTRDTVWQNICALQDCDLILNDTIGLFKQKVRVRACIVAFVLCLSAIDHYVCMLTMLSLLCLLMLACVQESIDIVAANPEQFSMLDRTQSNSSMRQSMTNSEYSSDSRDETDEEEGGSETFQDVIPVTKKKEALALNDDVTARVKVLLL